MMEYNEELTSIKMEILGAVQEARNAASDIQQINADIPNVSLLEAAHIRLTYVEEKMREQLARVEKLMESTSS